MVTNTNAAQVRCTVKFLEAISRGKYVVGETWLARSQADQEFKGELSLKCDIHAMHSVDPNEFVLSAGQMHHGMNVAESLERARRRKVFQGLCFYLDRPYPFNKAQAQHLIQAAGLLT